MRVGRKIAIGYGLLIAILVGGLGYQVTVIDDLRTVAISVSSEHLRVASMALDLQNHVEEVRDWTDRYFSVGYPFYLESLNVSKEDFARKLRDLRDLAPTGSEGEEVERLSGMWREFVAAIAREETRTRPGSAERLPPDLDDWLIRIQSSAQNLYALTSKAIEEDARHSEAASRRAQRVSWSAAIGALVISLVLGLMTLRSISGSLSKLTAGTRAIAKEQFSYRLHMKSSDEFAELAQDFNSMARRLGELEQLKKDFVFHVSHDLKAPLASSREMLNLMAERIPGPLTDRQERLVRLTRQNLERLALMVSNLLDVARLEAGGMHYDVQPNSLQTLLEEVRVEFDIPAAEKNVRVVVERDALDTPVPCDGERLKQVLRNLLENAIKFSPVSGTVVIRLERKGTHAFLSIADSGPGVPDEHKERIFAKFHQVKRGGKIAGQGVGLGLAICKAIVEAHQGRIWVANNTNGGSIFKVSLPLGEGAPPVDQRLVRHAN